MNIEEISQKELIEPLITRTIAPDVFYFGHDDKFQYFKRNSSKYKVSINENSISKKDEFSFSSWEKGYQVYLLPVFSPDFETLETLKRKTSEEREKEQYEQEKRLFEQLNKELEMLNHSKKSK